METDPERPAAGLPECVQAEMINGDTAQLWYTNPYLEDTMIARVQRERISSSMTTYYVFRPPEAKDELTDETLLGWAFRAFEKE